jgi:hypothetical protein
LHITVIASAMLCGMAFGLPLTPGYYWVVVPVVVLAGAIPISPKAPGVMEFFAILLTRKQNATVSQAFALTMSIRPSSRFYGTSLAASSSSAAATRASGEGAARGGGCADEDAPKATRAAAAGMTVAPASDRGPPTP